MMEGFGDYVYNCRVDEYYTKVFTVIWHWEKESVKARQRAGNIRKFINRCEKVGWEHMDEVKSIKWFDICNYIRSHEDLFYRLWKLETGHDSIFFC